MQLGATPHYFMSKSNGWHKSRRTENGSLPLRGPFIDDFATACWESRRIIMSAQEWCGRRREIYTDEGIWNMWTQRQLSWTYGSDQMACGHNQYYHESNAITSLFKVTVWAAHQFFQLILLSVWPRGPHFTIYSYTVSCHWCTVSSGSSGIIRGETGKEGKPFRMLLHFQHWDLRRVEHSGWFFLYNTVSWLCGVR